MGGSSSSACRKKCITLNGNIRKKTTIPQLKKEEKMKERPESNYAIFQLKKLQKEEEIKSKLSRRKKIKIRG